MIEYPLEVVQKRTEERRIMARALIDFEMLLTHLRTCSCFDASCLTTHHQIQCVQRLTEQARRLAHEVVKPVIDHPFVADPVKPLCRDCDQPEVYHRG